MIKFSASLKLYFVAIMLIIGVGLLLGYFTLARYYFTQGLDTVMVSNMQKIADIYREDPRIQENQLFKDGNFSVANSWHGLPLVYEAVFVKEPEKTNSLYKVELNRVGRKHPHDVYFLLKFQKDGQLPVFVGKHIHTQNVPDVGRAYARSSFNLLHIIALLAAIGLVVLLFVVVKSIGRPVEALGEWAEGLDGQAIAKPVPQFRYQELNQLANLIHQGLFKAYQSLAREERFLKHASHELRTPIAVIRNNVELLKRLHPNPSLAEQSVLDRLYRAGLTMTDLTNTLLWLGHEQQHEISRSHFPFDSLVGDLSESLKYLLEHKSVTVHLMTKPYTLYAAKIPCQIVLTNLIRNAYQHSWSGDIRIEQCGDTVTIANSVETNQVTDPHNESGFGLGLVLIQQLCQQFGWQFSSASSATEHAVSVQFCDMESFKNKEVS